MAAANSTRAPRAFDSLPLPHHTPGPWYEHSHRQIGPADGVVCEVWSAIGWGDDAIAQADANVRLIAAAPKMFEALATIISDYQDNLAMIRPRTMQLLRAALSEVEGVSHERD